MANPVILAIKPLVKAIGKEALKLIAKQAAKAGTSAAVTTAAKGGISSLDALHIMRAAVDKRILPTVAKSLGMSTKELQAITKGINITDARRKAVQGKNFIKNVNRFVETPQKTVKQYLKNELRNKVTKSTQDALKKANEGKENSEEIAKRNALSMLEGKLKAINPKLKLPKSVWRSVDDIDIDTVFEVMEYLEVDFYYTANNSEPDNPIYLDETHKGYKRGLEQKDFVSMIESMLLNGHYSTPIDGII